MAPRPASAGVRRAARPVSRPARAVAADALVRIERDDAYANLVLPAALSRSGLSERDRAFVTQLVYGVTRMRRACDWLIDRFVSKPPDPATRAVLRLGAYQLAFLGTPAHAAVSASVAVAPARTRGLVNAVLRRVSEGGHDWPDEATRLSYPDWIIDRVTDELGHEVAVAALESMNESASAVERADGYRQDTASQWVTAAVGAGVGDLVVDLCAGPGGKATGLAATGARVVAVELHAARAGLVVDNANELGAEHLSVVVADGRQAPLRPACADRVLVDAPCSGLGSLRRRADARWRIEPADVPRLAHLQRELLDAAVALVRPGGKLVYSTCTLLNAETLEIDRWLADRHPQLVAEGPEPGALVDAAVAHGRGLLLLPQAAGTDGMFVLRLRR
jgi:16S rRNA (cytosine967-C5)-methyltransferase